MGASRIAACTVLALSLLPFTGLRAQEAKGDPATPSQVEKPYWEEEVLFWAVAVEEYRGRTALAAVPSDSVGSGDDQLQTTLREDESDHDLRFLLDAGARDRDDRFLATFAGAAFIDVDGSIPENEFSTFASMNGIDSTQLLEVYELAGEYHSGQGFVKLARAGRQTAEYGWPVPFDGATLTLGLLPRHLDFFVMGGRTVHFYETDADLFEDWVGSGGVVVRPTPFCRLEADYRYLQEDTILEEGLKDHSYGVSYWNRYFDWMKFNIYARGLDDVLAHAGGKGRLELESLRAGADFNVDFQPATIREVHEFDNPFFSVLGESLPHSRWLVDLWKETAVGDSDLAIHAGWNGRALLEGDQGPFNREFARVYLLAEAMDLFAKGPFLSLTGELHYDSLMPGEGDENELTYGGAAGYHSHDFRAEAGTYYQRFKYAFFRDVSETADVRTWYGALSVKPMDWLTLKARYEYERFDWDIHTVIVSAVQAF